MGKQTFQCGTCGKTFEDYASNRKKTSSGKFYCSAACRVIGTIKPTIAKEVSQCVTCKQFKASSEFYPDPKSKNNGGLQYSCKSCTKERRKAYYDANLETIIERVEAYAAANPEVHRRHGRKQRQKSTYLERAARRALNAAVKNGQIAKPSYCSRCGKTCRVYGHHHCGYERQFWLTVYWLCGSCHAASHGRGPKARIRQPDPI